MLKQADPISAPAQLLSALHPLDPAGLEAIARVAREAVREIPARRDIVREGERPQSILFVLEGWGCRYKQLRDGRRQVVSIMLPGDMCDADTGAIERMDHTIAAISAMKVAQVNFRRFDELREHPEVARAIVLHERAKIAIQREWTMSLGQRSAIERISHLLCELFLRLESVGAVEGNSCEFPLTQSDIADACGLTPVHVNRILQELRKEGLVELMKRRLFIPNLRALMDRALFDPNYLYAARRNATFGNG